MNEFAKIFNDLAYRHNYMSVFDDFLTASICALSLGRMEEEYHEVMKAYSPEETKLFGQLFGAMVEAYNEKITPTGGWGDILGQFFEEHNGKWGRDANGQFFTPPEVCDLMAQITAIQDNNAETVNDPACGSGRCLIALNRINPKNRFRHFYTGMDIDSRCVKMCTINFFMVGMKGVVIHMDSIGQKVWGGYRVFLPETAMGIRPLTKEECFQFLYEKEDEDKMIKSVDIKPEPIRIKPIIPVTSKPKQLTLF